MAGVALLATASVLAGSILRIGPFAATPAIAVTDPEEIVSGTLQAFLDAATVHVDATLTGTLPAGVAGIPGNAGDQLNFAGALIAADLDLAAVRSRLVADIPALADERIELRTIWDVAWLRTGEGPWASASVADAISASGIDVNPLSLVDRLEAYFAAHPDATVRRSPDVPCEPGRCRVVTVDAGLAPLGLLAALLPDDRSAHLPEGDVVVTILADAATLRPVTVSFALRDPAGRSVLAVTLRFSAWNTLVPTEEPSPSPEVSSAG